MQPFPAAYLQHESPIHSRGTHNALCELPSYFVIVGVLISVVQ